MIVTFFEKKVTKETFTTGFFAKARFIYVKETRAL